MNDLNELNEMNELHELNELNEFGSVGREVLEGGVGRGGHTQNPSPLTQAKKTKQPLVTPKIPPPSLKQKRRRETPGQNSWPSFS